MSPPWWREPVAVASGEARQAALERQAALAKPNHALGRLENLAVALAGWQGTASPRVDPVRIVVFCGDHGVCAEGVSAYPQSVTAAMANQLAGGGAAIAVLARELEAALEVVDVGLARPVSDAGLIDERVAAGTSDACHGPAMSRAQCERALAGGARAAQRAAGQGTHVVGAGERGIGTTTAASALACRQLGAKAEVMVGPGAGIDDDGRHRKRAVVGRMLARNGAATEPVDALAALGGFEIAALAGAMIGAAQRGLPVLVDGFIASTAALVAVRENPSVADWLLAAHCGTEPGHGPVLEALGLEPLLDLRLGLGEGSAAALVVPLLRSACALHNGMARLDEIGVDRNPVE
jgi:nicotinate-nucleotide--dimethylbenzimidazole phosphoribosyltransferase